MKRMIVYLLASLILLLGVGVPAEAQIAAGTVNAKQTGTWTVQPGNTANTTAWLVTGTGGTFPVTGTITANIGTAGSLALDATIGRAQASTTAGQTGPLIQGAVTTAAPTYTTAQTSPLSLTTAGLLRVDASGVTVPTVPGALTAIATGQQAVTTTATALPASAGKQVCVKVLSAGTQVVYYGATGVTTAVGMELSAGDASCMSVDNANRIFVIAAATGSTVAWQVLN